MQFFAYFFCERNSAQYSFSNFQRNVVHQTSPRVLKTQPHDLEVNWTPTMLRKFIYTKMRFFVNFFCERISVKFSFSNFQRNVVHQTSPRAFKKQPHAVELTRIPTMLWKTIYTQMRFFAKYFCDLNSVKFSFSNFQRNVVHQTSPSVLEKAACCEILLNSYDALENHLN